MEPSAKLSREEVVALMGSSSSEEEWDRNCDMVKAIGNGQYPGFWFIEIIASGMLNDLKKEWRRLKR